MKDSTHKTEVNDLIGLVESEAWTNTFNPVNRVKMVYELYDRLKLAKRFVPPTEEEVELFMAMELQHWPSAPSVKTYTESESRKFVNFYGSKGWMVGKNRMKDWHAAARGWLARNDGVSPASRTALAQRVLSDDPSLY